MDGKYYAAVSHNMAQLVLSLYSELSLEVCGMKVVASFISLHHLVYVCVCVYIMKQKGRMHHSVLYVCVCVSVSV